MIKNFTLKALQKAINHALSLDETRQDELKKLEGNVLQVIINPLSVSFYIVFSQSQLQLLGEYEGAVNTTIQSNPIGLIRLSLLPASKVRSLFNDQITISGDVELGQAIKKLFDDLDIDWEGHLARFTGDVVAFQVGSLFRQGISFKNRALESLNRQASEYFQEELRLLPPREEIEDFFKEIDALSLQVERIAAHFNQLMTHDDTD